MMETAFGCDISQLYNNGGESCFEMNKAKKYTLPVSQSTDENTKMYWIHGESICPEMQAAIQMAKNDFAHLWPDTITDLSVAELIFQIMALRKTIHDLIKENARLKEEKIFLESRLQTMVPKPRASISSEPMSPVNEISMCTASDEAMTPTIYHKLVPGVNTILACGEKIGVDEDQSTAVTTKVCLGIDQLAHMFYCNESVQRSQAHEKEVLRTKDLPLMETADSTPDPRHTVSLYQPKDENSSRPCSLRCRKEEFEQPPGLQIFKDPEGLACRGEDADVQRQRHPHLTLKSQFSPTKQQPLEHLGEENLAPRCLPPLHENFSQLDLTGSRIDLVPCCASTPVFSVSPSAIAPISEGLDSISSPSIEPMLKIEQKRLQPVHQEFKPDDNNMEMKNLPQSPDRPSSSLTAAFNHFVHSSDQYGRLRVDATMFVDTFFTRKSKNLPVQVIASGLRCPRID